MAPKIPLKVEVGQRIRASRTAKGWTGQKLAETAQISPAYLSEVERGLSEISSEKLMRIASALDVSVQSLLEGALAAAQPGAGVMIPTALAEAAEQLHLSYRDTVRLLEGRSSLMARRSSGAEKEWGAREWVEFHGKVKDYLSE